eukprot:1523825-Rhodomonas_salina.1
MPETLPEGSWKTLKAAAVMPEKMGFCPTLAGDAAQQELSPTPDIAKLQTPAQTRGSRNGNISPTS